MVATPGTIPALPQYQPGALHLAGTEAVEIVNSTVATAAASYFMFLTDVCGKVPSVLPGAVPSLSDRFALFQAATGLPISAALSDLAIPQGNVVVGGTAGQVYVKNSATNFDAGWTTSINFLQLQTASVGTCFATNGVVTNLTVTNNGTVGGSFNAGTNSANYIALTGAGSGSAPLVIAQGSDTNVALFVEAKGTGSISLASGNANVLVASNVSNNAVNWIGVSGAPTGNPPAIGAVGIDANIGLTLTCVGTTSQILFAPANISVLGLFTPSTSCVNSFQMFNAVTGLPPTIAAQGADTNVAMQLSPKGTAVVSVAAGCVLGTAALASAAVNGFLWLATTNGTPTGTPTAFSGRAPLVYDTTNNKLWFYNGAWRAAAFT